MHLVKASTSSIFVRVAFIVLAAVVAYFVGQQDGDGQRGAVASSKKSIQTGPSTAALVTGSKTHVELTRDQALERWMAALAIPNGVVGSWFRIMPELNPADIPYLIEQIGNLPRSEDRDFAMAHLYLGLDDPSAAISITGNITNSTNKDSLMNDIYKFMAAQDRATALTELANLPAGQPIAYYNVFQRWAGAYSSNDPDPASLALALPMGTVQMQALRGLAAGWAYKDPDAALAWASNLPPEDSAAMNDALIIASRTNPNVAAKYVDKLTDASERDQVIEIVSQTMSHSDPAAALDWLDLEATGDSYDNGVINIFATLAQNDPANAASFLDKVNDPTVRQTVISNLAKSWAKYNTQAAVIWLQSLPDSDATTRDTLVQRLTQP